jgi:hypothetical protein
MSESFNEINEALTKFVRRAVKHYGDAVSQYGQALIAYSKGEEDIADFAKTSFNLAISEAQEIVGDGFALSEAYYRWAFSMVGINPLAGKKSAKEEPEKV